MSKTKKSQLSLQASPRFSQLQVGLMILGLAIIGVVVVLVTHAAPGVVTVPTKLIYGSSNNNLTTLHTINPDGGGDQLLAASANTSEAVYSPDGTKIASVRTAADGSSTIDVMTADGSSDHQLTLTTASITVQGPLWSSDGTKIAYTRHDNAKHTQSTRVMTADGADDHQINPADITINAQNLAWVPGADTLVASSGTSFYSVSSEGSNWKQLADVPDAAGLATVISSSKVLFSRGGDTNSAGLWLMTLDGALQRIVAASATAAPTVCNSPKVEAPAPYHEIGYAVYNQVQNTFSAMVYNLSSGKTQALSTFSDRLSCLEFSHDGTKVIATTVQAQTGSVDTASLMLYDRAPGAIQPATFAPIATIRAAGSGISFYDIK